MKIKDGTWVVTLVGASDDRGSGKCFLPGTKGFVPVAIDGKPLIIEVYERDNRDFGMCIGTIALKTNQVEVIPPDLP